MKFTTRKISAGKYALIVDGRESPMTIEKGSPAKYYEVQQWHLCNGDRVHFTGKGKADLIHTLEDVLKDLGL